MDSPEDESSFGEGNVAETEELAEHDPGEPEGNMNNTEQGVRMLPLWVFLSGVRTWQS